MMMRCHEFEAQVVEWVVGVLPKAAEAALQAHAGTCTACDALRHAERDAEARLVATLRVEVPADLEATLKAALRQVKTPRTRRTWSPKLALAAAAMLAMGLWLAREQVPSGRAMPMAGQSFITTAGHREALTTQRLRVGQRISTGDRSSASLRLAGAQIWLGPDSEVLVNALDRGDVPPLTLHRGRLRIAVHPRDSEPFTVATAPAQAAARAGTFELMLQDMEENPMNLKYLSIAGSAVGAIVLYVAVGTGDVEMRNTRGSATLAAGARGIATDDTAPRHAALGTTTHALSEERDTLRRELDIARAEVARLRAQLKARGPLESDGEIALRPTAEVKIDILALLKAQGVNIFKLSKDHPLFRELLAMGPEGIKLLGDILKTGDDMARFGAAALMERLADPSAVPFLEEAFFSEDNAENLLVQRMASHAMAMIGGEAAVPVLERIVEEGSEWGVQVNAAYGLAEMGRDSGINWILERYRSHEDASEKMMLLGAMAKVGHPSYLPEMYKVLQEETEYSKRYIAVTGIAKAARQESLPILEAIINDPNEDKMIIAEAQKAYDEIKGED